jgi:hypothetical protein
MGILFVVWVKLLLRQLGTISKIKAKDDWDFSYLVIKQKSGLNETILNC